MKASRVGALVWIFIYAGLLMAGLGLFVVRQDPSDRNLTGGTLIVIGGVLAVIGTALIVVRSRMRERDQR